MNNVNLLKHTDDVNALLARYGVKFGIYKNNVFIVCRLVALSIGIYTN